MSARVFGSPFRAMLDLLFSIAQRSQKNFDSA